jgi:hypothetical protein
MRILHEGKPKDKKPLALALDATYGYIARYRRSTYAIDEATNFHLM